MNIVNVNKQAWLSCEVYQTQYLVLNYLLHKSTLVFKALKSEVKQLR